MTVQYHETSPDVTINPGSYTAFLYGYCIQL